MARRNKRSTSNDSTPVNESTARTTADSAAAASDKSTAPSTKATGRNSSSRRDSRRGSNRSRSGADRRGGKASNPTLDQMNVTSNSGSRQVFSLQSAAMQSFGNLTTTPGQDNFIVDFNNMYHGTGITDVPADIITGYEANRTANIAVFTITPYFGSLGSGRSIFPSPVMQSALNLKQYVDTSFGTRTNYTAGAMMLYLMAVANVFPLAAEIRRDLRLAVSFLENQYPQFVPRGLFAALGITDDELQFREGQGAAYTAKELRPLIDEFNQLLNVFNRLPIPPEMSIFGYNDDLLSSIFTDTADTQTAQLYAFKLKSVWMYNENTSPTFLQEFPLAPQQTVRYKLTVLGSMIEKLTNLRTDSTAMLQNLFNAYGSRDTITIPLMDISAGGCAPIDFVYDPRLLIAIENGLVCDDGVKFSNVGLDVATASKVDGHVYVEDGSHANVYFNLPLQFHCAPGEVSAEMIGWALRFHPAFLNQHTFTVLKNDGTEETLSHVTCDGYSGFCFLRSCYVCRFNDNGYIQFLPLDRGDYETCSIGFDFQSFPMTVYYTEELVDGRYVYTLHEYSARRDVELTYRLEDLHMHWVYLTQDVWAGALNRNVVGTRVK